MATNPPAILITQFTLKAVIQPIEDEARTPAHLFEVFDGIFIEPVGGRTQHLHGTADHPGVTDWNGDRRPIPTVQEPGGPLFVAGVSNGVRDGHGLAVHSGRQRRRDGRGAFVGATLNGYRPPLVCLQDRLYGVVARVPLANPGVVTRSQREIEEYLVHGLPGLRLLEAALGLAKLGCEPLLGCKRRVLRP